VTSVPPIESIEGRGLPLRGNDIDTDRIIPARHPRAITFEGLGRYVFEDERAAADGRHPFDDDRFQAAKVLVVNRNFGSGSSREHAPQALHRWGIDAIVGESFAEIFYANCAAIGVPCLTLDPQQIESLQSLLEEAPETQLRIDLAGRRIEAGDAAFSAGLPEGERHSFLSGQWDALGLLLDNPDAVEQTRRRLPYLSGFTTE
jgi:3-isopropylmalate/(R)-2-methylmalate dehydratase small subunit